MDHAGRVGAYLQGLDLVVLTVLDICDRRRRKVVLNIG